MRTTPLAFSVIAMVAAVSFAAADAPKFDEGKLKEVPRMNEMVEKNEVAGTVTLVATREGVVQVEAVGKANLETGEAMKPDAMFWIASMVPSR